MNTRIYDREKITKMYEEYAKKHRHCPECGSSKNSQTHMGFILNVEAPETYVDKNRVTCSDCGWKGIVHDLVEKTP